MLDSHFIRGKAEKDRFTPEYTPDQSITSYRLVNKAGDRLSVLFPPWHGGGSFYERLVRRLANRGDAVLAYYFHDEILKPDADKVAESFAYLRDTIAGQLKDLTEENKYSKVRLMAMSLGNPVMAMVTSKFEDFDSATMVPIASSLARSTWHGTRTQHIRAGIELQGHDLVDLEELWKEMAPINHIEALRGKDVSLVISSTDRIIPAEYQMEYLEAAEIAGINPAVHVTRLGHYAAIGKFCSYDNIN